MKQSFVEKFDIINEKIDSLAPLTIGNGNLAFTMDITGLQTLAKEYKTIPLLTMANKFAQKEIVGALEKEKFLARDGRIVSYMTTSVGQEEAFTSRRTNRFKYNMFNLAFYFNDELIKKEEISLIKQRLYLYYGLVVSKFTYQNEEIITRAYVDSKFDTIVFSFKSRLFKKGLNVRLSANEAWYNKEGQNAKIANISYDKEKITIADSYRKDIINYKLKDMFIVKKDSSLAIYSSKEENEITLGINSEIKRSYNEWPEFWLTTKDYYNDNLEIQRRIVLSLYLIRVNSMGIYPPAETGLTCNSWYGKFHLEMHLWHHLGMIYYGHSKLVLPAIDYYLTIFDEAKKRAQENGFLGARWPKMTDETGLDSPSEIGCLLMWQQPHLIFMLAAMKKEDPNLDLTKYKELIYETALCLKSFFVYENGKYYLDKPLRPAQEFYEPETVDSPIFEVEYFIHALGLATTLLADLGLEVNFSDIINKAVLPKIYEGAYEGHLNTTMTYTKYNHDHPLPIMPYSFFKSERLDPKIMENSLEKILKTFNIDTMWGWDFPSFAMCLYHLGKYDEALTMLLSSYPKNTYLKNGHNIQYPEEETLPLYLPGNGAFLIASHLLFNKE